MYIICINCGKAFMDVEAYNCPFCNSKELTLDDR